MAQHDYNIANATFPNTRTDINNALGAIATNNSGDAQPSTMFANQWWYETDTNKLYIRNEDNDAWIHILTLNQTNDTVASLEGASSLAGIDDQSSSNDDQITITDTAVVINEDSDDLDFRVETNDNANMLFISGANNVVGVGAEGDLGVGLHIKSGDSGLSSLGDNDADELVIEGSANSGISILSGTGNAGRIYFGDSGDVNIGFIHYAHDDNAMLFGTNATNAMSISDIGAVRMPLQPAFLATTNQNQQNVADGFVTVGANYEMFDQNSDYNTSTYHFTAPVGGRYVLFGKIAIEQMPNDYHWIYAGIGTSNRTHYGDLIDPREILSNGDTSSGSNHSLSIQILADLDANDTAYLFLRSSAHGTNIMDITNTGTVNPDTFFSGYLAC